MDDSVFKGHYSVFKGHFLPLLVYTRPSSHAKLPGLVLRGLLTGYMTPSLCHLQSADVMRVLDCAHTIRFPSRRDGFIIPRLIIT